MHFLTGLCAIVGGIFTGNSLLNFFLIFECHNYHVVRTSEDTTNHAKIRVTRDENKACILIVIQPFKVKQLQYVVISFFHPFV